MLAFMFINKSITLLWQYVIFVTACMYYLYEIRYFSKLISVDYRKSVDYDQT